MLSIDEFLDESGLPQQFQARLIEIVNQYGVKALAHDNFVKMVDSLLATALITYAIAGIAKNNQANTTEELQKIMSQVIDEMSPGAEGSVIELKDGEDPEELLNMYQKASANTLPC